MSGVMRVALGSIRELTSERLRFAKQLGVSGIQMNRPLIPTDGSGAGQRPRTRLEFMDYLHLRSGVEDYGLRLEAIENPVAPEDYVEAMLGLPGRDEQIELYRRAIRDAGRAGIRILGYGFAPNGVWRTSRTTPGRGGAQVTSFDLDLVRDAPLTHGRAFTDDEMWANYTYFIHAVLPVAEEAGVTLALHPNDPPVESLGGIARIFRSFESFRRAMEEIAPSPNHGLNFCLGCWSEMGDALGPMKYFAERGKIVYVHFRDVRGSGPRFQECFLGEGNTDLFEAMLTLKRSGFTGFLMDDHVPLMEGDTSPWHHRGRALATGYLMGLLSAVDRIA